MQYFDRRPHRGSTEPYLIVCLQGSFYVMCGAIVGCVICEWYAFFIKKCMSTYFLSQNLNIINMEILLQFKCFLTPTPTLGIFCDYQFSWTLNTTSSKQIYKKQSFNCNMK